MRGGYEEGWAARLRNGVAVGGLDYGAVSAAVRRMEIRRKQERAIKTVFNRVLKMLNI